jgi:hypothetical protein
MQVADWIEARCAIPDREFVGNPFLLTDEQLRFVLNFYRLVPETGEFFYHRGGQLVRPQKWGKGPFSAAALCVLRRRVRFCSTAGMLMASLSASRGLLR